MMILRRIERILMSVFLTAVGLCGFILVTPSAHSAPKAPKLEKPQSHSSDYLVPNEDFVTAYRDTIEGRSGAMISVGTFRVFNTSQWGDFLTIGFDYSTETQPYNESILELILEKENRIDALIEVFGKNETVEIVEQIKLKKISDVDFYRWLFSGRDSKQEEGYRFENTENLREYFSELYKSHPDQWAETVFGSEAAYQRVREKAKQGMFRFATGDLTGSINFKLLGKYLKANSIPVSVIDISNSMDYFSRAHNKKKMKAFLNNIKSMPLADDAVLLFTGVDNAQLLSDNYTNKALLESPVHDEFVYMSVSVHRFLAEFKPDKESIYDFINRTAGTNEQDIVQVYDTKTRVRDSSKMCLRIYSKRTN
jgi:hypothetical protein